MAGPTLDWTLADHALAVLLVVAMPFAADWEHRRFAAAVLRSDRDARWRGYVRTMVVEWILVLVVVILWLQQRRALAALGLPLDVAMRGWIGFGVGLAAVAFLVVQGRAAARSPEAMQAARRQLQPIESLIPRTDREARAFAALSITAGICEEILYRGFLLAWCASFTGAWLAAVLTSIAFGMGHAYQGAAGVWRTGLLGLGLAALALGSGALWAPMLVHAVIDLNSGWLGRRALAGASNSRGVL